MRILISWLLVSSVIAFAENKPQGAPTGKVVQIVGTAKAAERALGYGDPVFVGEVIRTETASRVKILMTDRSVIDVGEDSAIRIRNYPANLAGDGNRDVELELGAVRASVKKSPSGRGKFFIRTKSSVLAVRGTEVSVDDLKVVVYNGIVDLVGAGGNVLRTLTGGQSAAFDGGNLGGATMLSQKQLMAERAKNLTNSFADGATTNLAADSAEGRKFASLGGFGPGFFVPGWILIGGIFANANIDRGQASTGVPVTVSVRFVPTPVRLP